MPTKTNVSRVKITLGYALMLAVLLFSLFFVDREMSNLMTSADRDTHWEDSLMTLLKEKDRNTIRLLRMLSEANDSMLSTNDIEQIIAQHDTIIIRQRVQQHVTTRHDTIRTPHKEKKSFFRRLGEVFSPPKEDTTIQIRTSTEVAMDTVYDTYNPVDSLQERLKEVAQKRQEKNVAVQRRKRHLRYLDKMLNARIDSLLKGYEQDMLIKAREEDNRQEQVRQHSARIIGGIAVGAVLLSAFFLILIGRDVTRSNRYRRELEEARRRAEDLLETREKLMLAITHDFKAPLGSIMGYADLLSRLTVDERQRFYLDNMKTSSEHLLKLVVDLLDFHRLDLNKAEVNRVSFHPARLLDEIRVSFEPLTAAKGLTLNCEIAPELEGTYICDPLRLRQIINNLLSNAVKFTEKGSISLKARYEQRLLVVAVTDTGKGIKPDDRERIFQEFTRLPGAQGKEGFGLGLSIVRMLVQLLEGSIEVDSTLGQGSTFTLRVPIYPIQNNSSVTAGTPQTKKTSADTTDAPAPPIQKKVILIDDDRIQLTLTAAMLKQGGLKSVCCQQVDELLEALRTQDFDVLLTDVQMPAINGFDLLTLLRESNIPQARTIPIIAVTARSDMKHDEFVAHGFSGCLHKPFTVAELLAELAQEKPSQERTQPEPQSSKGKYNFAALTAFTDDDPETSHSILESFVNETHLNIKRLEEALNEADTKKAAAVAHKMIPLFTLVEAEELAATLRILEASASTPFSAEIEEKIHAALLQIQEVLRNTPLQND